MSAEAPPESAWTEKLVPEERCKSDPGARPERCRDRRDVLARMRAIDPGLALRYRQQEGQ